MDSIGIVEVCQVFGLNYSRVRQNKKRGPQMQISCPLALDRARHSSRFDEKPSCSVTVTDDGPSKAYCHAASCGFKGSFLDLIRKAVQLRRVGRSNKELADLIKAIKEAENVDLGKRMASKRRRIENVPKTLYAAAMNMKYVNTIPEARIDRMESTYHPYAEKRGITEDQWHRWGLRYDGRKRNIVFPVRSVSGALVGMAGRGIDGDAQAKKNYPGLDKASHLLGQHLLIPEQPIIVVEGPVDCVKSDAYFRELGAGVVATLGEGFSDRHGDIIRNMRPPVVYIFCDGDKAGYVIASKIANVLSKRVVLKFMKTPLGEDPGSLTREQSITLYNEAVRVKKFIPSLV